MESRYRPAARVPASWLKPGTTKETLVPFPFADEDEATMAVAAVQPLLAAAKLAPAQLRRVVVSSRTGSGFAPVIADALGIPRERVEEAAAVLFGQTRFSNPGEGPVVHVHSDAPRPGGPYAACEARARLSGPGVPDDADLEAPSPVWQPDRDTFELVGEHERSGAKRTTMGAYVPRATWDRSLAARYRLEGTECGEGHLEFPPRPMCGRCGRKTGPKELVRNGTLETFTVVAKGAGPSEYEPFQLVVGDYLVGVAGFDGVRVPAMFTETAPENVRIGMPVETVFRRLYGMDGEWRYGLKFRGATS